VAQMSSNRPANFGAIYCSVYRFGRVPVIPGD